MHTLNWQLADLAHSRWRGRAQSSRDVHVKLFACGYWWSLVPEQTPVTKVMGQVQGRNLRIWPRRQTKATVALRHSSQITVL